MSCSLHRVDTLALAWQIAQPRCVGRLWPSCAGPWTQPIYRNHKGELPACLRPLGRGACVSCSLHRVESAISVANRAATVYWAITAVLRESVDTTCVQKPKTPLGRMLAAARARRVHVVQFAPCRHIAVSMANRAAFVYWAVTTVPRKSVDTTCLQEREARLARMLAAARARRLHVVQLAPGRHISGSMGNRAATVYWAVTAVLRESADTTCLQKPKTPLGRMLAAARERRLHVLQLAPGRHAAISVANRAATVYWAVTAVLRKSVDTTCLLKPKTPLARILAATRARRLHSLQQAP